MKPGLGAYGVLTVLGIGWGLWVVFTKIAVSTGHHPLGLLFWQQAFTTGFLGLWLVFRRRLTLAFRLMHFRFFVGIALLGTVVPSSIGFLIAGHLPAGVLAIIIAMTPMFTLAIALPLKLEQPSLRRLLGVLLGAGAIVMVVGPEAGLPDPGAAIFVLIGLLMPLLYGGEVVFVALRMPRDMDPVTAIFGGSCLGFLMVAPLMAVEGVWVDLTAPWGEAEWALLGLALAYALCYSGYVGLVRLAGALFASLITYVVTIAGVMWGVVLLGESHSPWFWASLAVMLVGMTLVQPNKGEAEFA